MLAKKRSKNLRFQKKPIFLTKIIKSEQYFQYGRCAIISKDFARVTKRQIETLRRSLTRILKKKNKIWIRARLNYPVTAKPLGIRMGKGKGAIAQKIKRIKPGLFLVETSRYKKNQLNAFKKAVKKLPIQSRVVWSKW